MRARPLVFVAMPFGRKRDPKGRFEIDFDAIYEIGIKPVIATFDVDSIRADEERGGGMIHRPMFERLLLAEIAIVDVTFHNANVFYELGVRHAARPRSTIIVCANEAVLPFDLSIVRTSIYPLENGVLTEAGVGDFHHMLAERLKVALSDLDAKDSPLFELIPKFPGIALPHEVAESFRDRVQYVDGIRERLAVARRAAIDVGLHEIEAIEQELGAATEANSELIVDVILSYRDIGAYGRMIEAFERLPAELRDRTPTLREQYAFALNRRHLSGDRERAIAVLEEIISRYGDSAETCSLLGRIHKDLYNEARASGERSKSAGHLEQAIEAYRAGFTSDPRDFYPGVNLATLLATEGSQESQRELNRVVPAVMFALSRLGGLASHDYWVVATVLEVSVLGADWRSVDRAFSRLLSFSEPPWMFKTTFDNLVLLRLCDLPALDRSKFDELIVDFASSLLEMAAAKRANDVVDGVVERLQSLKDPAIIAAISERLRRRSGDAALAAIAERLDPPPATQR